VEVGDTVIAVAGQTAHGMTKADIVALIKSLDRPLTMVFDRPVAEASSVYTITIGDGPLGLGFDTRPDGTQEVLKVGGQCKERNVEVGDTVVSITGQPVHGMSKADIVSVIQGLARPFEMEFARPPQNDDEEEETNDYGVRQVTFGDGPLGLGFDIRPSDGQVEVLKVGGQCKDQGMQIGDILLIIGDQDPQGMSKADIVSLIQSLGRPLTMTVMSSPTQEEE
jgi:C-terminal processing protease CtpA/Prc